MILSALNRTTTKAAALAAIVATAMLLSSGALSAQSPRQIVVTATLFDVRVETFDPPAEGYNLDITLVNPTDEPIEAEARIIDGPDCPDPEQSTVLTGPECWKLWQASLFRRVDSIIVERVVLPPNSRNTSLNFHFVVPSGTANGEYVFRLGLFDGARLLDDVEYNVTVAVPEGARVPATRAIEVVLPGGFELDTRFDNQQGRVGEPLTFAITLRSRDRETLSFTLGAETPPGWQVSYRPSFQNTRVGALSLTGAGSQNFDVEVVPPANAGPGAIP